MADTRYRRLPVGCTRDSGQGRRDGLWGFWEERGAEGGLYNGRKSVEKEAWKSTRCEGDNDHRGLDVMFLLKLHI